MRGRLVKLIITAICMFVVPRIVSAQGAIGGVVRDSSGALMPGVTVEAASDALIEKVRTAVTDSNGEYLIVNLRPGTYQVTFTLQGFATLKRENLTLSAAVTLPLNAQLTVAGIEQSITVTGASPVVDVENTKTEDQLQRALLDSIPRNQNQAWSGALLPGVFGTTPLTSSPNFPMIFLTAHGSETSDAVWAIDGFKVSEGSSGNSRMLVTADIAAQEYTYEISGISADVPTGGVRSNVVLKDGGNSFTGSAYGTYTSKSMVATDNLTPALMARGLTATSSVAKDFDASGGVGGPIKRDSLWFYTSFRRYGSDIAFPAVFNDVGLTAGTTPQRWSDENARLTWQVTPKNKLTLFVDGGSWSTPNNGLSALTSIEATTDYESKTLLLTQGRWTAPISSRLLLELGVSNNYETQCNCISPLSNPDAYSVSEITTGQLVGQRFPNQLENTKSEYLTTTGALSYVTGSHDLKVGFNYLEGYWNMNTLPGFDRPVEVLNHGLPFEVYLFPRPLESLPRVNADVGLYAQDRWKLTSRVTLNVGLRFDYLNEEVNAESQPAGNFVPARNFPAVLNVPNWKDISPRVGAAWDVFGNGKTAIRGSVSRYVRSDQGAVATSASPMSAAVGSDVRTWTDPNWNSALCVNPTTQSPAQCQPQLSQLGPSTNLNFGQPVFAQTLSPSITNGWGVRGYNWEQTVSVQHQVMPGLALNVGYYRRSYGNLLWVNNTDLNASDYTPFTITSPLNGQLITMYNLQPQYRGRINNVVELAPNDSRVFQGVDVVLSGRFGNGGTVTGGVDMGRTALDGCTVTDPNLLRYCSYTPTFFASNHYKAVVSYPLPWDIQISGVLTSSPTLGGSGGNPVYAGSGPDLTPSPYLAANYTVTSAIAGVPLTNGSINVNLAQPGSFVAERFTRVDVRLAKTLRLGSLRLKPYADVFNLLNESTVLIPSQTYGPTYPAPAGIVPGRTLRLGAQLDF
jgi:hypothetical protein